MITSQLVGIVHLLSVYSPASHAIRQALAKFGALRMK